MLNAWIDDQISARFWNNAAGGAFAAGSNWDEGSAPGNSNIAVFNIAGTYSVNVASAINNRRIRVRAGSVTMNLSGNTYTLGVSSLESSLTVARGLSDIASLSISNGTMSAVDVGIGEASGTTGKLTIASGGLLTATGTIGVGGTSTVSGGTGSLQIDAGGALQINNGMRIWSSGRITNAGSVSWSGGSINVAAGGSFTNQSGGVFDAKVATSMAPTAGAPVFNNAGVIRKSSGAGTTTVSLSLINTGTIQSQFGSLTLNGGGSSNGGTFITAASARIDINGGNSFTMIGTNTITGSGVVGLGSLVSNTGTLRINSPAVAIAAGTLSSSGTVDLNGYMILDYSGSSPISAIKTRIVSGYNNGAWTGSGINSSSAATIAANSGNLHKTGIGFGEANVLGQNFAGQITDLTALLMRYTYFGDANLDGQVNTADFSALSTHFNATSQLWNTGDFNYDGTVNALDYNALASNFGSILPTDPIGSSSLATLVPEPASLSLLAIGSMMLYLRSRRSR
jgi:fibronectin-binding autotransporter adhesin